MKNTFCLWLALLCLFGVSFNSSAQEASVEVDGYSYTPNTLESLTYLPIGSFQVTKAYAIDQIAWATIDTWSISVVGRRNSGPKSRILIPKGSSPAKIAKLINNKLVTMEIAMPEEDSVGYYVSLEADDGSQLFWGQSDFRLILVNGNWEAPEGALNPEFKITSNLRFRELDGVQALQVLLRDDEGQIKDSYYVKLNGRGILPVYFSGMRGEVYAISRLSDGTEIRKAFSLGSMSSINEIAGTKVSNSVNPTFKNVNDGFAVNESRPKFTIRSAGETYTLNRLTYNQKTEVVFTTPTILFNGKPVVVGKCKIIYARVGTQNWMHFTVSDGDPIMIPLEAGEYWVYPQVNTWGETPDNPETYRPYKGDGDERG